VGGIRGKLLSRDGSHDEGIELARSGVVETRASDDIEGQGNALVFLAEAQAASGRFEDAAVSAAEARTLFVLKGNVVSAARIDELLSVAGVSRSGRAVTPA
jgi:hypothetical protein